MYHKKGGIYIKKSTLALSGILLLSSPLSAFANDDTSPVPTEETVVNGESASSGKLAINKDGFITYPSTPSLVKPSNFSEETTVLYSGPIGGDDDLEKPVTPTASGDPNVITPQVVINDSSNFSWEYETTTYGSDKLVKNGYSWLATGILAVPAGWTSYGLVTLFSTTKAKTIAGTIAASLWGKGIKDVASSQYTYWTVKRYVDKDSYNVYHKYVVRTYADSRKTQLLEAFTEVNSNRYR